MMLCIVVALVADSQITVSRYVSLITFKEFECEKQIHFLLASLVYFKPPTFSWKVGKKSATAILYSCRGDTIADTDISCPNDFFCIDRNKVPSILSGLSNFHNRAKLGWNQQYTIYIPNSAKYLWQGPLFFKLFSHLWQRKKAVPILARERDQPQQHNHDWSFSRPNTSNGEHSICCWQQ